MTVNFLLTTVLVVSQCAHANANMKECIVGAHIGVRRSRKGGSLG